jgi:hypothetical protein
LVWWIGARLVEERERACDEEVLRRGGKPRDYAEGIVSAERRCRKAEGAGVRLLASNALVCVSLDKPRNGH